MDNPTTTSLSTLIYPSAPTTIPTALTLLPHTHTYANLYTPYQYIASAHLSVLGEPIMPPALNPWTTFLNPPVALLPPPVPSLTSFADTIPTRYIPIPLSQTPLFHPLKPSSLLFDLTYTLTTLCRTPAHQSRVIDEFCKFLSCALHVRILQNQHFNPTVWDPRKVGDTWFAFTALELDASHATKYFKKHQEVVEDGFDPEHADWGSISFQVQETAAIDDVWKEIPRVRGVPIHPTAETWSSLGSYAKLECLRNLDWGYKAWQRMGRAEKEFFGDWLWRPFWVEEVEWEGRVVGKEMKEVHWKIGRERAEWEMVRLRGLVMEVRRWREVLGLVKERVGEVMILPSPVRREVGTVERWVNGMADDGIFQEAMCTYGDDFQVGVGMLIKGGEKGAVEGTTVVANGDADDMDDVNEQDNNANEVSNSENEEDEDASSDGTLS